jgi:hypothetical protein
MNKQITLQLCSAINQPIESKLAGQDSIFSNIVDLLGYFARIVRKLVEAITQNPSSGLSLFLPVDNFQITGYNKNKEKAYAFPKGFIGSGHCGAVFRFSDPLFS